MPPKLPTKEVYANAGLSQADIDRIYLVREYQSTHRYAAMVVAEAKENGVELKDVHDFDYYEFLTDRRNEVAAQLLADATDSYRILAHHRINLEQLAVHAQLDKGAVA